jgi:hypothetical protein
LVDGAARTASIKALTYCDTFRLEREDFARIMKKFPQFRASMEAEVADRVAKFKQTMKAPATRQRKFRRSVYLSTSGDALPTPQSQDEVAASLSDGVPSPVAPASPRGGRGKSYFAAGSATSEDSPRGRRKDTLGSQPNRRAMSTAYDTELLNNLVERVMLLERNAHAPPLPAVYRLVQPPQQTAPTNVGRARNDSGRGSFASGGAELPGTSRETVLSDDS